MTLQFGFSMNPLDLAEARSVAGMAEAAGYDRVGVWDSPAFHREAWVTLASLATTTPRLQIGPWVTNPLTRHPVVTASAAASLDQLAPGRVVLGIGTGDSGVYNLAQTASPLAYLQRYVEAVRLLLTEGEAPWEGGRLRMRPADNPIPIWVAAHGARSAGIAGGLGDGVILGLGVSPDAIRASEHAVRTGAEEAGKDADALEIWHTAPWYVDDDTDRARDEALWHVASLAHHISRNGTAGKLIPESLRDGVVELGRAYDLVSHGAPSPRQRDEYRRVAWQSGVADYLIDRFTFAGDADECARKVWEAVDAGARNFDCANDSPVGGLEHRPRVWAEQVLPLLANEDRRLSHV